jgi:hypothetical protein
MQAVTRVNAEQASKQVTWEPTRLSYGEGRRWWGEQSDETHQSHRGIGDGMHDKEADRNTGSPCGEGVPLNRRPARDRPGRSG